jgi:hypothetical protein
VKAQNWKLAPVFLLCAVAVWALVAKQSAPSAPATLMPDGALLYLQAEDFHSLLDKWNQSPNKRAWLNSDNYAVFSQSRLFGRLSQAQEEFSAAAGIPVGPNLLETVAGKESALGLYDIGNLEFVYMTRMTQTAIEATPLWQTHASFEQRSEAGTPFYVRVDPQSKRVAAFATKDGWLILGTREDLVAGVLDRLNGSASRSLASEAWFVDALRQAPAQPGDLRMVLDLTKIVPSPYFRSYWVQQNITEMKQYASAVSDLDCGSPAWREQRVLLRKTPATAQSSDVSGLIALVPSGTAFWSARATSDVSELMNSLRDDLLDPKPASDTNRALAPSMPAAIIAGSATDLDTRIDQAPAVQPESHPWLPLDNLLSAVQPAGVLTVYATGPASNGVFLQIHRAMVVTAAQSWNTAALRKAIAEALAPELTVGNLGVEWEERSGPAGDYFAFAGQVALWEAVRGQRLFLANDADLLQQLLAKDAKPATAPDSEDLTYAAAFNHSPTEQARFRTLTGFLDRAGNLGSEDNGGPPSGGQQPAFFSGNIASFSRVFANISQESIEQRDHGSTVTQIVRYMWSK